MSKNSMITCLISSTLLRALNVHNLSDVSDVCMDDKAVSSNAIISMLLDGTVVIEWCKRTFMQIIQNLQDICIQNLLMIPPHISFVALQ